MRRLIQQGFSMVQALVLIGAVSGAGAMIMRNMQEQNKLLKTADVKSSHNALRKELAEAMADTSICYKTFEAGALAPLVSDLNVSTIKNGSDELIYNTGELHHGLKITSFILDLPQNYPAGYPSTGTLRIVPATFITKVENPDSSQSKSYGGRDINLQIPIHMLVLNERLQTCISSDSGSVLDALIAACEGLLGTYNASTGICENLHGPTSHVAVYLRDYFCSENPSTCQAHPYAGRVCNRSAVTPPPTKSLPPDVEDNAVIRGFDQDGNVSCACLPRLCPDPALFCSGTNLGNDWCYQDCPVGTKTTPPCS